MNNQIKKINLNHSFIFFLFCNIFSLIAFKTNTLIISPLICLFLILIIGISHGSLDDKKGKKLFQIFGINNFFIFYLSYILIALIIIIISSILRFYNGPHSHIKNRIPANYSFRNLDVSQDPEFFCSYSAH